MEIEKNDHAVVGVVVAVDYTDVFRYEGFAVDLADKLAGILHFNHTFRIVADKKVLMKAHHDLLFRNDHCRKYFQYGSELSPGRWNGMLGEVGAIHLITSRLFSSSS